MISQGALEEAVLSLLCYSSEHATLLALKVNPKIFINKTNFLIAKTAIAHIGKYANAPGQQMEILLEAELRRGEEGKLLKNVLNSLLAQSTQLDPTFIISELDKFIEIKTLQNSYQNALELLEAGNVEDARTAASKQYMTPMQGGNGILFQDPSQSLRFLDRQEIDFFSSGIEALDKKNVRPDRKTMTLLIAAAKKGKSWFLSEVGKAGLQQHHKVLHITLEISEDKVACRYMQSIFGLTKTEASVVRVPIFNRTNPDSYIIEFSEFERESIISKQAHLRKRLPEMASYPPLIIKEFPTGALSTEQFYMYLETLERERSFRPDLVIVDYADLMKLDATALRVDTGRLYRELRGIAVTRNFALVTATQGNRESEYTKVVTAANVAEDWSKIGTADTVLTYSQTPQEKTLGLARIFVSNSRDSEDKFISLISQNYACGQFCLDSVLMHGAIYDQMQSLTATENNN